MCDAEKMEWEGCIYSDPPLDDAGLGYASIREGGEDGGKTTRYPVDLTRDQLVAMDLTDLPVRIEHDERETSLHKAGRSNAYDGVGEEWSASRSTPKRATRPFECT